MAPTTQERMMSRREAAEFLGVHYNTVRGYEERGLLTPERVSTGGGIEEVRYPRSEVEGLVTDGVVPKYRRGHPRPSQAGSPDEATILALEQQIELLQGQILSQRELIESLQQALQSAQEERRETLQMLERIATGKR